ncbi:MAG: arylamine N-acetyltransferase, partial [Pseudomonadota bacterium]
MNKNNHTDAVQDFLKLVHIQTTRNSLDWLGKIMRAFQRLPFENLTKILRTDLLAIEAAPRMPEIVLADHIDLGAGGTCFSLNFFLQQILEHAGFDVYPVVCDRSYGPNTHCALVVTIDNIKYFVDPGYLMLEPLEFPIQGSSVQKTPFNITYFTRLGVTSQYTLVTEQAKTTRLRYRLKDKALSPEEFKKHWIESFNWPMMHHICITKLDQNGHIFVRDNNLRYNTIEKRSGEKIKTNYEETLSKTFGIDRKLIEA